MVIMNSLSPEDDEVSARPDDQPLQQTSSMKERLVVTPLSQTDNETSAEGAAPAEASSIVSGEEPANGIQANEPVKADSAVPPTNPSTPTPASTALPQNQQPAAYQPLPTEEDGGLTERGPDLRPPLKWRSIAWLGFKLPLIGILVIFIVQGLSYALYFINPGLLLVQNGINGLITFSVGVWLLVRSQRQLREWAVWHPLFVSIWASIFAWVATLTFRILTADVGYSPVGTIPSWVGFVRGLASFLVLPLVSSAAFVLFVWLTDSSRRLPYIVRMALCIFLAFTPLLLLNHYLAEKFDKTPQRVAVQYGSETIHMDVLKSDLVDVYQPRYFPKGTTSKSCEVPDKTIAYHCTIVMNDYPGYLSKQTQTTIRSQYGDSASQQHINAKPVFIITEVKLDPPSEPYIYHDGTCSFSNLFLLKTTKPNSRLSNEYYKYMPPSERDCSEKQTAGHTTYYFENDTNRKDRIARDYYVIRGDTLIEVSEVGGVYPHGQLDYLFYRDENYPAQLDRFLDSF